MRHAGDRRGGKWLWLAAVLVLAALAFGWYLLPVGEWLNGLRGWMVGAGIRGIVAFVLIYLAAAVVLAPAVLLTVLAGFAYGFWGLPLVVGAATLGAAMAFLIARHLARDRVRRLVAARPKLAAVDRAVATEGWKIVVLLRLSPLVPFGLQNYVFGVTAIRFPHFVAATFFGIVPGTALYVYIGTLGNAAGEAGPAKWALLGAGLAATALVAVLIARAAKTKLRQAGIAEADAAPAGEEAAR